MVGVENKEDERPGMFLSADYNITGGKKNDDCPVVNVTGVAVAFGTAQIPNVRWADKLHHRVGNITIGDGSAHPVGARQLQDFFLHSGDDPGTAFNNHILSPSP